MKQPVFLDSMRHYQQSINRYLLRLENDLTNRCLLSELKSHIDHIKNIPMIGVVGGITAVQKIESIINSVTKEEQASKEQVELLFRYTDELEQLVQNFIFADFSYVLLVKAGGSVYAIPLSAIKKVLSLKQNHSDVPLKRLSDLISLIPYDCCKSNDEVIVFLQSDGVYCGIIVDAVLGIREITFKAPKISDSISQYIAGSAFLENGQSVLIIDPISIFKTVATQEELNLV